ncbi:GTPase/DUF3482 domain-containing protein [Desulfogranum mediterraneum]|uniref:GTPase/DUF3482 domain-containing protein n=1 Tax=Desulfogranum mediterraneum TaxID=160661 RepID=UPI0003F6A0E8|nr:GTPase/DUF3482 domain-containing protein [Desulfogranum mediterraneum]
MFTAVITSSHQIPRFAIIGHPNEGKSSVLSTLAEDDSVRVSPVPGETKVCQDFPVIVDGREVIRFIDTPGFQNPRKTLRWLQRYQGEDALLIEAFIQAHEDDPAFRDDCALLTPVAAGSGVIFVVDGSRPVRNMDRAEMEILRLSGAPRMAVINCKDEESSYLAQWQSEFRKHFNATRLFNSSRATYIQRIELLENLKAIDQQWEPALRGVVQAFQADWQARNEQSVDIILDFLSQALAYSKSVPSSGGASEQLQERLWQEYQHHVAAREQAAHRAIRNLYKHNRFNLVLPEHSILAQDLFSRKTWEFLGLTDRQIILAGAMGGAALGAGLDVATAGISFGVFSTLGGLLGAAGTAIKGKQWLSGIKLLGMQVGGEQLQVGPVNNIQLLYILLDRSLLFYRQVVNWAHGRRDYQQGERLAKGSSKAGFTAFWSREERRSCERFFQLVCGGESWAEAPVAGEMRRLLQEQLTRIIEGRLEAGQRR